MNDSEIIKLYFARDDKAVNETKNKYGKLCETIAYNILLNKEDTEECVNTVYYKMWNTIPPKKPQSFCGYLCAIVRNTAITLYNKRKKSKATEQYHELEEILSDKINVEQLAESKEAVHLINCFLKKTSRKNSDAFIMRYYFNMSVSDIAQILNTQESTVKSRLARTREAIRKYLIKNGCGI